LQVNAIRYRAITSGTKSPELRSSGLDLEPALYKVVFVGEKPLATLLGSQSNPCIADDELCP
jgi:hypothetical protein